MEKIILSICVLFVFVFSCASQPSGGGGGSVSSTSSGGIVISTTDGSQTIESLPDLKLKLKDMPDSLSDESLKLKSIVELTNLDKIKTFQWFNMATNLQMETYVQLILSQIKEVAKLGSIPQGEKTLVASENYTNKVKFRTDGSGGVEFLFGIWTNDTYYQRILDSKIYLHVYPVGSKAAFELIGEISNISLNENFKYKVYSYYNEVTGEKVDGTAVIYSFYSYIENFIKVYGNIPQSVNLVLRNSEGLSLCYGDSDKGGILVADPEMGGTSEIYNNKGDLIFKFYYMGDNTNNLYPLKYLTLKNTSYKVAREPQEYWSDNMLVGWYGKHTNVDVYYTNYYWWIETNNNTNNMDIEFSVLEEDSYGWSWEYEMVIPIGNRAYLIEDLTYFNFIETNRVNSMKTILGNLYISWASSNIIDIITNKNMPEF
ncbi:MAG: hypothetical protein ACP5Q5_00570 [Brevinematia bacterium]